MQASKYQVKVFANDSVNVEEYIPVFHRWIRENLLGELLIDVVDYSHVTAGPDVVLIGHAADYVLDRAAGRLGLLYARKRDGSAGASGLTEALRRAFSACAHLQREPGVRHSLAFRTDELLVRVADRLAAPNTDETFERCVPELRQALQPLYGSTTFELRRVGSPRELFSVEVKAEGAPPISTLLERAQALS
jgi:hypothetical protein